MTEGRGSGHRPTRAVVTARKTGDVLAKVAAVALVLVYFGGCVVFIAAWSEGPTPGWARMGGFVVLVLLGVGLGAALAMGLVRLVERQHQRRDELLFGDEYWPTVEGDKGEGR